MHEVFVFSSTQQNTVTCHLQQFENILQLIWGKNTPAFLSDRVFNAFLFVRSPSKKANQLSYCLVLLCVYKKEEEEEKTSIRNHDCWILICSRRHSYEPSTFVLQQNAEFNNRETIGLGGRPIWDITSANMNFTVRPNSKDYLYISWNVNRGSIDRSNHPHDIFSTL